VEYLPLLTLGFVVGLSGAMMPGPLLIYTITQSLRKGWRTGFHVIVGHAIVEVALMLLLVAGVSAMMSSTTFTKALSIVGGAFMVYTAWALIKSKWDFEAKKEAKGYGTLAGGILFTALNPGFPLWWATAGAKLLMEGIKEAGLPGAALVLVGHWGADFGFFLTVSVLAAKGREKLLGSCFESAKNIMAAALLAIGAYFIWTGL
jgi:threonine/homoserine/homoserine lactone efflux protein